MDKPDTFLGALGNQGGASPDNSWTVTLQFNNSPVPFYINTGVEVKVIPD